MTRQERGYDAAYDAAHRGWEQRLARGETVLCWRCLLEDKHTVITSSTPWDLGHDDHDRSIIRGPECRGPNRATASRRPTGRRPVEEHPAARALAQIDASAAQTPCQGPLPPGSTS